MYSIRDFWRGPASPDCPREYQSGRIRLIFINWSTRLNHWKDLDNTLFEDDDDIFPFVFAYVVLPTQRAARNQRSYWRDKQSFLGQRFQSTLSCASLNVRTIGFSFIGLCWKSFMRKVMVRDRLFRWRCRFYFFCGIWAGSRPIIISIADRFCLSIFTCPAIVAVVACVSTALCKIQKKVIVWPGSSLQRAFRA